jgi:tRNA A37 threonylcarbamoyladenosine modification protein TsaB
MTVRVGMVVIAALFSSCHFKLLARSTFEMMLRATPAKQTRSLNPQH